MGRVLMTWELGGGLGHLQRLQPLAAELVARGNRVWVAVRDLSRAGEVYGRTNASLLQSPHKLRPPRDEIRPPVTFPQILHNIGFAEEGELAALAGAWRGMYELVRPDVIVFDHSPTALLAARSVPAKRVLIGTGFTCPPDQHPMPNLRPWAAAETGQLVRDEQRVLALANRVLSAAGCPRLERLGQIVSEVDETFLATFPELDHYPERPAPAPRYRGAWNKADGRPPHWPAGSGPRVFAYLKPCKALPQLLDKLKALRCPTLVVCDGIDAAVVEAHASPTLRFETTKLDLSLVGRECEVAITNGNHGTTSGLLLAGKPVLHVPLHLEQLLLARAVSRLGAGLVGPSDQGEALCRCLEELLRSGAPARAAAAFATRHAAFDPFAENRRMADDVERLSG